MDIDTCDAFDCRRIKAKFEDDGVVFGHKAVLLGKYVILFGGYSFPKKIIYKFDISKETWETFPIGNASVAEASIDVAFLHNDCVYALAAVNKSKTWRIIQLDMLLLEEFVTIPTMKRPDLWAKSAGAFLEERREMVVLGATGSQLSVLDIDTWTWNYPKATGKAPVVAGSQACCSYRNVVYFAGGVRPQGTTLALHILRVNTGSYQWSKVKLDIDGYWPSNRYMFSLTCSSPHRVFAFGGYGRDCGMSVYSFKDNGWYELMHAVQPHVIHNIFPFRGSMKSGTTNHAAVQTKDFILIFGGYNRKYRLSRPMQIRPWV